MPTRPLRAAAVNAAPVFGDVTANVGSAVEWCEQAAEAGVELLVFPKAWNTGYDTKLFALDLPSVEDLSWLASLQDAVDRTSTVVLFNAALSAPDGPKTLTTIVLAPNASPRPVYDKQHLFPTTSSTSSRWRWEPSPPAITEPPSLCAGTR